MNEKKRKGKTNRKTHSVAPASFTRSIARSSPRWKESLLILRFVNRQNNTHTRGCRKVTVIPPPCAHIASSFVDDVRRLEVHRRRRRRWLRSAPRRRYVTRARRRDARWRNDAITRADYRHRSRVESALSIHRHSTDADARVKRPRRPGMGQIRRQQPQRRWW